MTEPFRESLPPWELIVLAAVPLWNATESWGSAAIGFAFVLAVFALTYLTVRADEEGISVRYGIVPPEVFKYEEVRACRVVEWPMGETGWIDKEGPTAL